MPDIGAASTKAIAELLTDSVESGLRGAQSAHGVSVDDDIKEMEAQRKKRSHKKKNYAEKIAAFLIASGSHSQEDIIGTIDDALNWDAK
jgi:hypothetical protein